MKSDHSDCGFVNADAGRFFLAGRQTCDLVVILVFKHVLGQ